MTSVKKRKSNPKSPWRGRHGGLGPLSSKVLMKYEPELDGSNDAHIPGVLDAEFFETPARLTRKELEDLL